MSPDPPTPSPRPVPLAPPPIVPTPASRFATLRGRRVIVGVPGLGFRGDLRCDDAVVRGGRTYVPVLTEQDYYRAETQHIEVFAPLVPIDRVWVEHIDDIPFSDVRVDAVADADRRAALDAPPRAEPVAVAIARAIMGRRIIQAVPDGFIRDLRAVTHRYYDATGADAVRVCGEHDWYRWALDGTVPTTTEARADTLWVE